MEYYVYIIQCSETKAIKIGRTSGRNPYHRISSIQTSNPFRLDVVRIIACDRRLEGQLHFQFSSYRINREWFKPECLPLLLDATAEYEEYDKPKQQPPSGSTKTTARTPRPAVEKKRFQTLEFSTLADFLCMPRYRRENTYIDSVWERVAMRKGVTVEQCFNDHVKETGFAILLEAYDLKSDDDLTVEVFADLWEYNKRATEALRNPPIPYRVSISKEGSKERKEWEEMKIGLVGLANSLDRLVAQYKKELNEMLGY